jgi:hypothetical protein
VYFVLLALLPYSAAAFAILPLSGLGQVGPSSNIALSIYSTLHSSHDFCTLKLSALSFN